MRGLRYKAVTSTACRGTAPGRALQENLARTIPSQNPLTPRRAGFGKGLDIRPARRLRAVALAYALLIAGLGFTVLPDTAHARPPIPPDVFKAVRHYWRFPADRRKAFDVIACETGNRYNTTAQNGQYLGLFQAGAWFRSRYGHGSTAMAQARAAHRGWLELGWAPWECA